MLSKIVVLIDHLEAGQAQDLRKYLLTKTYDDSDIFKVFEYLAASVKKKGGAKSPEYIHEKFFRSLLKDHSQLFVTTLQLGRGMDGSRDGEAGGIYPGSPGSEVAQ